MYIVWDDNIFMSKLTFVQFTRVKAQTPQLRITSSRWHRRQSVRKDADSLTAASRFRVLGNIIK